MSIIMSNQPQGDTFTKFPLLPKEIRLKIWHFALEPRVISFHRDRDRGRYVGGQPHKFMALTTLNHSHEILSHACAESFAMCQKRYLEWRVWDIRKGVSYIKFDLKHDVVYFSHQFGRIIDHRLLLDVAILFSAPVQQIRTLALPAGFFPDAKQGMDVLKALQPFESLTELIIVFGYSPRQRSSADTPGFTRSTSWDETSDRDQNDWVLPDSISNGLDDLKRDHWPDWKIPKLMSAKFLDDVLSV